MAWTSKKLKKLNRHLHMNMSNSVCALGRTSPVVVSANPFAQCFSKNRFINSASNSTVTESNLKRYNFVVL